MHEVSGRWPSTVDEQGHHSLIAEPGGHGDRRALVTAPPLSDDYSEEAILLLGKPKPETTSLRNCVVHVFQLTPDLRHSPEVTARCGTTLQVTNIQWLLNITGMPCEPCLRRCAADR